MKLTGLKNIFKLCSNQISFTLALGEQAFTQTAEWMDLSRP